MSRIGKQIINVPNGVDVSFNDNVFFAKGPKGSLSRKIREEISISIKDNKITLNPVSKTRLAKNLWGTYASHVKNIIIGVTEGYTKELEIHGVGYRAEITGKNITFKVGFSHVVILEIPKGLEVSVNNNKITVKGFDKELVGSFSAEIRAVKKPEPYKGKGIRYVGEFVRRKQGKKSGE